MASEKLCAHCLPFQVPELRVDCQSDVAARLRAEGAVRAMGRLTRLGLTVFEAKAVAMHVTRELGRCQRCSAALLDGARRSICRRCKALNLDW